jgi:hypothetical protein
MLHQLVCVILCSRCFLLFARCIYSELKKELQYFLHKKFFSVHWGGEFLKGKRKCKKSGSFLDLLFYFDPKKLSDNISGMKVTDVYHQGNLDIHLL